MSTEITPIAVRDDVLMIEDKVAFAVLDGAAQVTSQQFPYTSQSDSSLVYNIQVPSPNVVMDRELLWGADITVTVTGTPANGAYLVDYGVTDAFAPFPLNQGVTNTSIQINNTTVSQTTRDMLDPILRGLNRKDLARYNSTTPVYLDNYANYAQVTPANVQNWPMASYDKAVIADYVPRGCYPVTIAGNTAGDGTTLKTVTLTIRVVEPVMCSPFIYGDGARREAGMQGLTSINLQFSMDSFATRVFRFVKDATAITAGKAVTGLSFANSYVESRFYSPKANQLLPALQVLPYYQLVEYKTPSAATLDAGVQGSSVTNTIQLNAIPDKLMLFIKDLDANKKCYDADAYCAIKNVSILWNNASGLLSSANAYDLWKMSEEAGSKQSWLEFSGVSVFSNTNNGSAVNTTGSVLYLDFAKHIAINEAYFAPSSLGNFNLQITVNYTNTTGKTITPQVCVVAMTSGVFTTQNGQSASYIGVLNKEEVLKVSSSEPIARNDLHRYIGGSIFGSLKALAKKALPHIAPLAKHILGKQEHPAAKAAHGAISALGFGESVEGGRKKHIKHRLM